ncbi:MAG: MarR family winged helix-turn-helix transcriptional regulator [Alphaproteobacteria bacterium]|nr:MarR family winged helix-turn-helix transcriptional regulator [Alphaproteobacteria bacterium]
MADPRTNDNSTAPDNSAEALAPRGNVLAGIHVVSNLIGRAFFPEIASKWDLSLAEWRIVLTLAHRPGASAAEITALWGMEKMAVSRAARRLERTGRVDRTSDPKDGRRFTLSLTQAGRALFVEVEPSATARYHEIIAVLDRSEREALHSALTKLIEHFPTL